MVEEICFLTLDMHFMTLLHIISKNKAIIYFICHDLVPLIFLGEIVLKNNPKTVKTRFNTTIPLNWHASRLTPRLETTLYNS